MKKKILIPTDFSKNAWNALVYATELLKDDVCDFYILNTYNPQSYVIDSMMVAEPGEKYYDYFSSQSQEGLEHLFQQIMLLDDNSNHQFKTISLMGILIDCIVDIVEKKDIELIVMGTKGATGSAEVIFGTNTIYVMEAVRNCPILAIPGDVVYQDFKEIVFPTSFKTHYKLRELQYLIDFVKITNSAIRILHVSTTNKLSEEQEENKKMLEEYFYGLEHSYHYLRSSNVNTALRNFVESRESDMIVFINKKHNFIESLIARPMVKELGLYSKVPILALHDLHNAKIFS